MGLSLSAGTLLLDITGFFAVLALDLRRRRLVPSRLFRLPFLAMLDLLPPALTAGFTVALGACLYPATVSLGVLPLRTPAALGLLLSVMFLAVIWTEGRKQIQFQRPAGLLFAEGLVFAGAAFILLTAFFHDNKAQVIGSALFAVPLLVAGAALIGSVVPPFMKKYEGLRILERVAGGSSSPSPSTRRRLPNARSRSFGKCSIRKQPKWRCSISSRRS
jgi:hypothetical protein